MTTNKLRVLLCHNYYQQPGGEDAVFAAERDLLRRHGHETFEYTDRNDRVDGMNRLGLAVNTVWSLDSRRTVAGMVRETGADIVHFHNTFPLISPAVYSACRDAGAAVVQTLHNFRLMCPGALFFRNGAPCTECAGRLVPLPGVRHACYRGSRAQTAVTAAMLTTHKLRGTYRKDVDLYVALTEFSRRQFIEGGLPASKIVVKPNFLDRAPETGQPAGNYFLFAGRLAEGKGIQPLLRAWEGGNVTSPLRIAGSGPLEREVQQAARTEPSIQPLGHLSREELLAQMRGAQALIFPSEWYENFPVTLVEAFASGLPVIASRMGAMGEIVDDGRTGLHFTPGDASDLREKVRWLIDHPADRDRMASEAHREYECKYTGDTNYRQIISIYEMARESRLSRA